MKKLLFFVLIIFLFSCEKEDQCWSCIQQKWITFIDVASGTIITPRFYSSEGNGSIQCDYNSKEIESWSESQYYESVYVHDGIKRLTENITVCSKIANQ